MYLGFLLIFLGWAAFLSNVLALVLLPAFILYMNRFQISPGRTCACLPVRTRLRGIPCQGAAMALKDRELAPKQTERNLWNT